MVWLFVPYSVLQKLLIYWDFYTQPSLGFTENGQREREKEREREYPESSISMGENAWVMRGTARLV